ncbi:DNA helicase PIF1, ATP-dependent [Corchorus capsularis]|uniref:ATP-dependent DNA helicase n=1 Tax=Corchorus capsularis TaxID=210143 RepID=A0A1R3FUR8_COCAP|nr:DNA helicase PIF1, ATP-dependent [Corchorus capsularis]
MVDGCVKAARTGAKRRLFVDTSSCSPSDYVDNLNHAAILTTPSDMPDKAASIHRMNRYLHFKAKERDVIGLRLCLSPHPTCSVNTIHEICSQIHPQLEDQSVPRPNQTVRRKYFEASTFGGPTYKCPHCSAYMWYGERNQISKKTSKPKFMLCCWQGTVKLPPMRPTPPLLNDLLTQSGQRGRLFRENIRVYNCLFQFTSLGAKVDNDVNKRPGPYVFLLNGLTYHRIGSLLPVDGSSPKFAQLYVYDSDKEIDQRIQALTGGDGIGNIEHELAQELLCMLNEINEIARAFRMAKDRLCQASPASFRLRFMSARNLSDRNYTPPTCTEIAILISGDSTDGDQSRDIIIEHKNGDLKKHSSLHPLYMAFQYPLLFPNGEDGFELGIKYVDSPSKKAVKRESVTMRKYYAYQLQQRHVDCNTLLRGGRLLQQYMCDAFSSIDFCRLLYTKDHQKEIHSDFYDNVRDAMARGDSDGSFIGKRIIHPASYTGGSRYMFQNYQDAIAICRYYGYPSLFITFTCNPKWDEIQQALSLIPGQKAEDRPDIVSQVFRLKVRDLIKDLTEGQHFGESIAVTYTIEFQKRVLPHVHILLWLHPDSKLKSASDINELISAELPDPHVDRVGYDVVSSFMIHGPCGNAAPNAPCMVDGMCSKYFPKFFQRETIMDDGGYVTYRRRDTEISCKKNGIHLDNRFVVPHNLDLIIKYNAHINVKICNPTSAIKYLFKYVNKGSDRTRVCLEEKTDVQDQAPASSAKVMDEIKKYLDCRYIGPHGACWRIFEFDIHYRDPAVQRLLIHLPGRHHVHFDDNQALRRDRDDKVWRPRQQGRSVGRMISVHPTSGQLYYLRLLLNVVRGATCFEDIRTVNGVLYPTFQRACEVLGLLGDDKEWNEAMLQASEWATSGQLRLLFVIILLFCHVSNPTELFEKNWKIMADDIVYKYRRMMRSPRSEGLIVLAVASSGITSLLMPGGRTAHSRFKIPIDINDCSTCSINKGTQLAKQIQRTSLIVWDEAPMIHKHCLEALEKTLSGVLFDVTRERVGKPFGGKTIVLGGDFRQVLPVIPQGSKTDVLAATICNSKLWSQFELFTLRRNMRLTRQGLDPSVKSSLEEFAAWLLDIGDGQIGEPDIDSDQEGLMIMEPKEPRRLSISQLRKGRVMDYVILRVVRRWDTIFPSTKTFTTIDFLFVDDEGNAIHGYMDSKPDKEFLSVLQEGHLYKIHTFQVKGPKGSYNAIPGKNTLMIYYSAEVTEIKEDLDRFPTYYFLFANIDQIIARKKTDELMTDVIGILDSITKVGSVKPRNQPGEVQKRSLFMRLISGDKIKITVLSQFLDQDYLLAQRPKPIVIIAGMTVKTFGENMYLSTTSASKIYVNLDVPETAEVRARFKDDNGSVLLLDHDGDQQSATNIYGEIVSTKIMHLLSLDPAAIGDEYEKWLETETFLFNVRQRGIMFELRIKLALQIRDDTGKMQLFVFGTLAQDLAEIKLGKLPFMIDTSEIPFPDDGYKIIGKSFNFVIGLGKQALRKGELSFKVFKYTLVEGSGSSIKGVGNTSMVGEYSLGALETTIEDLALQTPQKGPTTTTTNQNPAASPDESTASPMPINDDEPCSVSEKEISSTEKTPARKTKRSPAKKLKSRSYLTAYQGSWISDQVHHVRVSADWKAYLWR